MTLQQDPVTPLQLSAAKEVPSPEYPLPSSKDHLGAYIIMSAIKHNNIRIINMEETYVP